MRVWVTFYRTVAFPLIGISLICSHQVWQAQSAYFVFRVVWVKVLTSAVIGAYITIFRSEQFVFYNNLGYSRNQLLLLSFLLDFLLWLFFTMVVVAMI